MKEIKLSGSSLLDCFSCHCLATVAHWSLHYSLLFVELRGKIFLYNLKISEHKNEPQERALSGARRWPKLPKVSPKNYLTLKNKGFVIWASSQVSLCASVSPGAGHFPTSPQPLSLLPSSISFCESSFKSKRGQLERILLKFHHHKRSTTGKNKTQCLMVIAHQKQNSHPKYPYKSFDLLRKAKAMDLHQDCVEEEDMDDL